MKKNMLKTNIIPVLCLWMILFTRGDSPPECYCPSEGQPATEEVEVEEHQEIVLQYVINSTINLLNHTVDWKKYNNQTDQCKELIIYRHGRQTSHCDRCYMDLERGVIHFSIKNATLSDSGMYQVCHLTPDLKMSINYKVTVGPRSSPGSRDKSNQIPPIGPPEMPDPTHQTLPIGPETLSPGEVVWIVLGVVLIFTLALGAFIGFICWKLKKNNNQTLPVNGHPPQQKDNLPLNPLAEGAAAGRQLLDQTSD